MKPSTCLTFIIAAALGTLMAAHAVAGDVSQRLDFIDAHAHATLKSASGTLASMKRMGIERTIVMPPPVAPGQKIRISEDGYRGAARKYPDKFVFFGGGASLNTMVHQAAKAGKTSNALRKKFEKTAKTLLRDGIKGFGEIAAEHLSLRKGHPYMGTPPDHPLFLLLSDIAGKAGVPIDFHMEAISRDMPPPADVAGRPNPDILVANIAAFERLLAHNRQTTIIWAHAGWGNTGERTAQLCGRLLAAHPNLFMSIKIERKGRPKTKLLDGSGAIKADWLELFRRFPERFVLGSDEKYDKKHGKGGKNTRGIRKLLDQLPPYLARRFAQDNPKRLFGL
ncbi:MAG: amidohydrolase family protein [Rhodospirillales bacterium]|nr:amidohydrolase family protein [Rhodospirillales bacterium]